MSWLTDMASNIRNFVSNIFTPSPTDPSSATPLPGGDVDPGHWVTPVDTINLNGQDVANNAFENKLATNAPMPNNPIRSNNR